DLSALYSTESATDDDDPGRSHGATPLSLRTIEQRSKIMFEQISNPLHAYICRGIFRDDFRVERVMALTHEHGRHSRSPDFFDRSQNAQLVVNEHVMFGRATALDIIEFLLFVHINQHAPLDGFK